MLEDAGYTVIVPAWWTPEGRRRTKVRLKTSLRSPKGAAAVGQGHFSLNTIISYEYQLSIGGQVVTEEEWQQLVNAKTSAGPVPRAVDGTGSRQDAADAPVLADAPARGARDHAAGYAEDRDEAEDDLEWDHDQALQDMLSRLHDKSAFAPIEDPADLQGTLRDYQKRGVAWLQYLEGLGLNPCLADEWAWARPWRSSPACSRSGRRR